MSEHWATKAACVGQDPRWWTLEVAETTGRYITTVGNGDAARICKTACPVRRECLADAVEEGANGVIRGGVGLKTPHIWSTCEHCSGQFLRAANSDKPVRWCPGCREVQALRARLAAA